MKGEHSGASFGQCDSSPPGASAPALAAGPSPLQVPQGEHSVSDERREPDLDDAKALFTLWVVESWDAKAVGRKPRVYCGEIPYTWTRTWQNHVVQGSNVLSRQFLA